MKVSLIMPARNEGPSVRRCLESVFRQTRLPDEIVIGDGCSTDDTVSLIEGYRDRGIPLRVVEEDRGSMGAGRNVAIEAATHSIIAAADFGTQLDPRWLESLVAKLEADPEVDLVAGTSLPPEDLDEFRRCVTAVTHHSVVRRRERDELRVPKQIIASTNSVAFRREIWERVGGFPEWIRAAEDKLFARKVHLVGGRVVGTLDAVVRFDVRGSLRSLFQQFYSYGKGNAQTRQVSPQFLRMAGKYALGAVLLALAWVQPALWLLLLAGGAHHVYRSGYRLYLDAYGRFRDPRALLYVPAILLVRNLAQICGHASGYWLWVTDPACRKAYFDYMAVPTEV